MPTIILLGDSCRYEASLFWLHCVTPDGDVTVAVGSEPKMVVAITTHCHVNINYLYYLLLRWLLDIITIAIISRCHIITSDITYHYRYWLSLPRDDGHWSLPVCRRLILHTGERLRLCRLRRLIAVTM